VLIVIPGFVAGEGPGQAALTFNPAAIATLLAVAALLPLRKRFPVQVLAACVGLGVLSPLWSDSNVGFIIAAAIATYRVVSITPRTRALLITLGAMVILVGGTAFTGPTGYQYAHLVLPAAFLAVAAAIGDATRNRRAYLEAMTERAVRAEETREIEAERRVTDERLRIARELHDAVAHQIAAISLHAGVASNALPDRPADVERALGVIRSSSRSVLSEISALLRVLRTAPSSTRPGLHASPEEPVVGLAALSSLVTDLERSGLVVRLDVAGDPSRVSGAASIVAYRVIQEGLANALKHGSDSTARVELSVDHSRLTVTVVNAVAGEPEVSPTGAGGHGLVGMRERVDSVRGTMSVHRGDTEFTLVATLPFAAAPAPTGAAARA
jgi:signal transduction histidine kinase